MCAGDFHCHCHCEGDSELSGQEPVLSANLSHHNFEFYIRSDIHSRILLDNFLTSDPHRGKFLAYILTYCLASTLKFYLTPYLHAILYCTWHLLVIFFGIHFAHVGIFCIISSRLCDVHFDNLWAIFSDIFSDMPVGISCYILSDILHIIYFDL